MSRHIVISHLRGSKSNRVEKFSLSGHSEITIGREAGMTIAYEDAVVSRRHAVIRVEAREPPTFTISDVGSTNGTFVNGRRLTEPSQLRPGDIVELGKGGPQFNFELDAPAERRVEATQPSWREKEAATVINRASAAMPILTGTSQIGENRSMKIAALALAILGTLCALSLSVYTYAIASIFVSISGGAFGALWRFLSVVIPIACIAGTGFLWTSPAFGGIVLLICAGVILLVAGFNFFSMATILLLGAGGAFALVSTGGNTEGRSP